MLRRSALALAAAASLLPTAVFAADTIKVGVLHSLSGTMAISETVLKDTVLMAIGTPNEATAIADTKKRVLALTARFPLPYKL